MSTETSNTDLQDQLLEALLIGNFAQFQELLGHPAVNPGHKYGKPHFSTCLEIACRHKGREEFVKELLTRVKPNINQIIPEPIHYAASKGNVETLEVLLKDKRTKLNAEDSFGRTALHHAAKNFNGERYERCIALLLARSDLDVNRPNKKGCTAIHEAATFGGKQAVQAILKYGKQDIDIDNSRGHGRTAREVILEKYPELKEILPPPKREEITSPEPQSQLLVALQNRHFEIFRGLLHQVDTDGSGLMDPNQWYGKPFNMTCLEMACREEGYEEFVKALLQAGADPNMVNLISEKSPIHIAAETGNHEALKILLDDRRTNVNAVDQNGRSALHCALDHRGIEHTQIQNCVKCISLLLQHPQTNVNIANNLGHTPILTAALSDNMESVKTMLKLSANALDLDSSQGLSSSQGLGQKTARDVILEKYPELESMLPVSYSVQTMAPNICAKLVQHLHKRQTKEFIEMFKDPMVVDFKDRYVNDGDGSNTFLQYACKHGLYDVADKLLQLGANPNGTHGNNKWPPVVLASCRRHHDVLMLFLKLPLEAEFNIDATDMKGNTALHYAAKFGDLKSVLALLSYGADIKIKNVFDKPPLPSKAVETLFNQCLMSDGNHYPEEDEYTLMFNYGMLVPRKREDTLEEQCGPLNIPLINLKDEESIKNDRGFQNLNAEMDFLFYLSQSSDHRPLLKHPIVTSFLHLKWHRIRGLFYINLLFYTLFVISLNLYILLGNESNTTNNSVDPMVNMRGDSPSLFFTILGYALIGLLCFLVIRELIQLIMSPKQYVQNSENLLDISLITCTAITLFVTIQNETITVMTVLLSWTELVLLTGRLPMLSRNIEMLKTVSWTFFRFMVWYSLLIMAFAISFYTMFRNAKSEKPETNFFGSPGISVFKTIIMMTGEFGSENIPFQEANITSHLVFVVFVFLIAIVLLNLLTGLAVSDTQAIQNDADILSLISRIRLVFEIENMLLQWHRSMGRMRLLRPLVLRFERWIKSITLFPPTVSDKHFCVLPNKGTQIISPHDESDLNCKMDLDTLGAAMNIIGNQSRTSDIDLIKTRLESIEKSEIRNKEVLDQVLVILQHLQIK